MMRRIPLGRFGRDQSGAGAAEFAIVLPLFLIVLLGTLDIGLYAWSINRAEKAVQMGARYAVVTDMIPSGLYSYSFATSGGIPQGTVVPASAFGGVTCDSNGCTCNATCNFSTSPTAGVFDNIVTRMQTFYSGVDSDDVEVEYSHSGLGFSGDPNGPDVAPVVTVRLSGTAYQPVTFVLFGGSINLPDIEYSLTAEDSIGDEAN